MTVRSLPPGGGEVRSGQIGVSPQQRPSRSDFAWEFLRRNPRYRAVARARVWTRSFDDRHGEEAARPWGLQFIADPNLPPALADVFWRPEVAPGQVVILELSRSGAARPLRLGGNVALRRQGASGLHLKLQTGIQALIREGDLSKPLAVVLPISGQFPAALRAAQGLQRTLAGASHPVDDLTGQQRVRLGRVLRALDGATDHQSYREIARDIFGDDAVGRAGWRTSSVRDTTIRLVRTGRALMDGAYLRLLRPGGDTARETPTAPPD